MGGSNEREGNLLVGNRPVCDDLWSLEDATVACKQLGFSGFLIMYLISPPFPCPWRTSLLLANNSDCLGFVPPLLPLSVTVSLVYNNVSELVFGVPVYGWPMTTSNSWICEIQVLEKLFVFH